jgi:hypothetical protein
LPRSRAIDNPEINTELRTHVGEAILFVECKWSVSVRGRSLFNSETDEDSTEKMEKALDRLAGASVREVEVTMPPKRIALSFDNGAILTIEADEQRVDDLHDNFTLSFGNLSFAIGPDLGLRVLPRKGVLPLLGYEIVARQPAPMSETAEWGSRERKRRVVHE